MKQFCGQGKEEPLSCWSNSEHPLTIIHRVVCDSWRSKALKNNRIREIFVLLFIPSLAAATNFAVGIKISQHHSDLLFEKWGFGMLSPVLPFVWSKTGLWWSPCHTSESNDINIRNQRKPGCRPPRFSRDLESQGKCILDKSQDYPCISYY